MLRKKFKWRTHENESTNAEHRGGPPCSSDEVPVMGMKRRGWVIQLELEINHLMGGIFEESKVV